MIFTTKQKQIMACVIFGESPNEKTEVLDEWLSMNELVEYVPYETTRDSMQFSTRALIKKGLIKKGQRVLKNGRWHTPLIPTDLAIELIPVIKPYRVSYKLEGEDIICEEF